MGTVNRKKCFVIMPFSKTKSCTEQKWAEIFEYVIKPAVEESGLGYECERSVAGRENIVKGILDALNKANVVIADLTDNNPNVFYELGVRHTLTNRTILIAQGEEHIPFDLRPYPVAFYGESPAKIAQFKSEIKRKLEDIETNPERSDNPVADFLKEKNIELLSYEKKANLNKLSALISEMSRNLDAIDPTLELCRRNQEARKEKKAAGVRVTRFENDCLQFLLSSYYIILPRDALRLLTDLNHGVTVANNRLSLWPHSDFGKAVEESFVKTLPSLKAKLEQAMRTISRVRADYSRDNYQEPEESIILLASPEHEEYLKST
jgi:hypothetical protein